MILYIIIHEALHLTFFSNKNEIFFQKNLKMQQSNLNHYDSTQVSYTIKITIIIFR